MPLTRQSAAAWHLAISGLVGLVTAALVYALWYPGLLGRAVGVTEIFLMVLVVDVAVGPLLTLVAYKPGKPGLRLDLALIAVLQVSALLYGVHTVAVGRPAFLVFVKDSFTVVRVPDVEAAHWQAAVAPYHRPPWLGPIWVAAYMPEDVDTRNEIVWAILSGGADLTERPQFYAPLQQAAGELKSSAQPLVQLHEFNPGQIDAVAALEKRYLGQSAGFLPLKARTRDMAVIVNVQTGEVLETADLRPWR